MKGWVTDLLGNVCDVVRGTTITQKQAAAGNVPVVAGGILPTYFHSVANRPSNTITVSGSGANAGYVNFYDVPIFASDCSTVRPKDAGNLEVHFVHYFLKRQQHYISTRLRQGAAQPHVYAKDVARLPINIPPVSEQHRIVAILDEAFAGLATATANAEKNLKNARELFESYLRCVLTSSYVGWKMKRLPEVAREFGRGKSKHRPRNAPKLYGGAFPFVQTGDISNADHWLTEHSQTYSAVGLAQSRLWPKGTVCIAIVGATVGETAILGFEACFPDSVIGVVPDDTVANAEYVEYLLQGFKAVLKEKGKGTARDNINLGTFENQFFPFPTIEEQRKIVARLNELAERRSELQDLYRTKLEAISALRQSILQKAFSGELTSPPSQAIKEAAE